MSATEEYTDYRSVTMVDFVPKERVSSKKFRLVDDDCLIVGASRYSLKPRATGKTLPDQICPVELEYYKSAAERFNKKHPNLVEKYKLIDDLDPVPIENDIQDTKRSQYMIEYCARDTPFMSINKSHRAKALQVLHLPDDIEIPPTVQRNSYRAPDPKYYSKGSDTSMMPKIDHKFRDEERRIMRLKTGETTYNVGHDLLAKVILQRQPFGKPRKEPRYGKWKTPLYYTYWN